MKNILYFFLAVCVLYTFVPVQAAEQSNPDAVALVTQAAHIAANTQSLVSNFTQHKRLAVFQQPLIATGVLCFARGQNAVTHNVSGDIFWIYQTPTPSGFAYTGGQGYLWDELAQQYRKARGQEATALKAISTHISTLIQLQPHALEKIYRMEVLPPSDTGQQRLRLYPRHKGTFFAMLDMIFSADLRTVDELIFIEPTGDYTQILLSHTRINEALPPQCTLLIIP